MKKSVNGSPIRLRAALILLAAQVCVAGAMAVQAPAIRWVIRAGGNNGDEGDTIALDAAGNCYVTGGFASTNNIMFGNVTLTNAGVVNIFVAKYDNNGSLQW